MYPSGTNSCPTSMVFLCIACRLRHVPALGTLHGRACLPLGNSCSGDPSFVCPLLCSSQMYDFLPLHTTINVFLLVTTEGQTYVVFVPGRCLALDRYFCSIRVVSIRTHTTYTHTLLPNVSRIATTERVKGIHREVHVFCQCTTVPESSSLVHKFW